jgi:hypothetical protein
MCSFLYVQSAENSIGTQNPTAPGGPPSNSADSTYDIDYTLRYGPLLPPKTTRD